jgi:hypothetical protein
MLLPSATATPQPTVKAAPAPDLSTMPRIKSYLRSLGLDPSGFVIQRGAKNYAGPNCPGASWNCTTAPRVVQISTIASDGGDGENRFVCKPAKSPDTIRAQNKCVIVQNNPNSNNSATCDIQTRGSQGTITQTCFITQTGRRNNAFARQVAGMSASGTDQDVFQNISVKQTSTGPSGNTLETNQQTGLVSRGSSDEPVTQDVHQTTCANQLAGGSGPNFARAAQSQILFAQKNGASAVDIDQNTALDPARCDEGGLAGGPASSFPIRFHPLDTGDCAITTVSPEKGSASACTRIHQTSCATNPAVNDCAILGSGKNTIRLGQLETMLADVNDTTGGVDVTQGNFDGIFDPTKRTGTDATLDQQSTVPSQIFFDGFTGQVADFPSTSDFMTVRQTDFGGRCCAAGHQETSNANDFDIEAHLFQRALVDGALPDDFPGGITQEGATYGDCETTGQPPSHGCVVDLAASNNEDSDTAQCGPDTGCHEQVSCFAVEGKGSTFGECSNVPPDIITASGRRIR